MAQTDSENEDSSLGEESEEDYAETINKVIKDVLDETGRSTKAASLLSIK